MTGPDSFGHHHQQQPGGWPPAAGGAMQPPWTPPPGAPWGPSGPHWAPTPPPRRSRGPWIIGGALIAAIAIGATTWTLTRGSSDQTSTTATTAAATNTPAANSSARKPFYMLADPADALPTTDEIKQTTLLDLSGKSSPMTVSGADHPTVPPTCTLVTSATTQSMWGDAKQLAGQQYTDNSGNTAWAGVAAWETNEQAAAALAKLITAVQSCPQFVMTGQHGDPDSSWVTSDVQQGERQISWTTTMQGNDRQWKCGKAYKIKANLAVTTTLCTTNPSTTPTALADLVLDKATKSK